MTLTPESYIDWIRMVKSYAEVYQIWNYINSIIIKILIEPKRPEPSNYQSKVVKFIDLNVDSREIIKKDRIKYRTQII
jgi:hypothetical protein